MPITSTFCMLVRQGRRGRQVAPTSSMSIVTSRQPLLPTAACTLNLTAHDLAHRKYGRLWAPGVQLERHRANLRWPMQIRYCEPQTTIVDVGSFVGDDLVKFLSRCTANLAVHTFEPVRRLREQLLERRGQLAHPEYLQSHAFGLGDSNCFLLSPSSPLPSPSPQP